MEHAWKCVISHHVHEEIVALRVDDLGIGLVSCKERIAVPVFRDAERAIKVVVLVDFGARCV